MTRSKQRGTAFESLVLSAFRLVYPHAARSPLQGANDKGDLLLPGEDRFIVECKHVTRFNLAEWYAEAQREASNAGVPAGVVVHKRRGNAQPLDQWVTMTVGDFLWLVSHEATKANLSGDREGTVSGSDSGATGVSGSRPAGP